MLFQVLSYSAGPFSIFSTLSCDLACRGSCHAQLLLCLNVEGANCQNVKHLPTVIDLLVAVVHVSESLPEGLTL